MLFFQFMYAYYFIKIFKLIFYGIIMVCSIMIIGILYRYTKGLYVLKHIDNVYKIEISQPIQTYRKKIEESGFSIGRYITRHYRVKHIPYKKIWKAKAYFKNNRCLRFEIKENSKIYNKIMNRD